jgi:phosphoglucosamine mutase
VPRFFGTDGVRGLALSELTVQMAEVLGHTAVSALGLCLLIGRDTRLSSPALEAGLVTGITAAGGRALLAGVIPTPAIALLTREYQADGGVVISASHNPPEYNGIKFFDSQGYKLTKQVESVFEAALQAMPSINSPVVDTALSKCGEDLPDATERYIAHAVNTLRNQGLNLNGLKIVVDCANGAAYRTTPEAFRRLGAEVVTINTSTDGASINVGCGSTNLSCLQAAVLEHTADLGFAHDGDADRVIAVDAFGSVVDGDFIKAICAVDLKQQGRLTDDTVVTTVMANLGFFQSMARNGIKVKTTAVGDSKVLSAMLEGGYTLGGEQSGHVIFLEHNTTGDGLISALQLMAAIKRLGQPLHELATVMRKYPQVLVNIEVNNKEKIASSVRLQAAAQAAQDELAGEGRVLLRPSGTEPLFRVMVEASDVAQAEAIAKRLSAMVSEVDE